MPHVLSCFRIFDFKWISRIRQSAFPVTIHNVVIYSNDSQQRFMATIHSYGSQQRFTATIHGNDSQLWFTATIHSHGSPLRFTSGAQPD